MNNLIKKIEISSFRSIEKLSLNANEINVFTGSNDTGKSNILKALNLFFNNQTDFLKQLKFEDDYNKVSRAKAIRSAKTKQLIKIRIHLNVPKSYKSLSGLEKVYIERQFDRVGNRIDKYCSNDYKVIRAINTLINKVSYIYIPALKGEQVLQYLLSLIGERELVSEGNISMLNENIKAKTSDLQDILEKSGISIGTTFGLPTLLSDFWQKLTVNTLYDKYESLDKEINGSNTRTLNPNQFNISLLNRGEGIKSKYIPPLLKWLDTNDKSKEFIWGIDEPENSLEFGLANQLASLFYNEYAKSNQIFLTTHSLAFINPPEEINYKPLIFRIIKDKLSRTTAIDLASLFKQNTKEELFEDLGVLEAQKEFIENYRKSIAQIENLKSTIIKYKETIQNYNTNVLFVEGPSDKEIIEKAIELLKPNYVPKFRIIHSQANGCGHSWVKDMLISWHYNREKNENGLRAVGLFDFDNDSNRSIEEINRIGNHKGIKVLKLYDTKPEHLISIFRRGIKITFAIEELFKSDVWQEIYDANNDWFEDKIDLLDYNSFRSITKTFREYYLEKGISSEDEIFMKKIKNEYKESFCKYVCHEDFATSNKFEGFTSLINKLIDIFE